MGDATPAERPTRACLWCASGSSPLTLEHVVALWLEDVLQGSGAMHHTYADHGADAPSREWSAVRPDFKAKAACEQCNNGWMSDLETVAKARVSALVDGRQRSLSRADCAVLARWAAKTALMFQACEAREVRVVPAEAFHSRRMAGNPGGLPATLRVWSGSVDALGVWSKAIGGTLRPAGQSAVAHFTILLTVDRLSFMVMGCADETTLANVKLGHLAKAWTELSHRTTGIRWPPPYRFPAEQFPAMPELLPQLATVRPTA